MISTKTATATREAISSNSPENILLTLTPPTQQFLNGVYIADNAGNIPAGHTYQLTCWALPTNNPTCCAILTQTRLPTTSIKAYDVPIQQ